MRMLQLLQILLIMLMLTRMQVETLLGANVSGITLDDVHKHGRGV
jgi:hypothetical protein